jgi:hypothetical protein
MAFVLTNRNNMNQMSLEGIAKRANGVSGEIKLLLERTAKLSESGGWRAIEAAVHAKNLEMLLTKVLPYCKTQSAFQALENSLAGISRRLDHLELPENKNGMPILEPIMLR